MIGRLRGILLSRKAPDLLLDVGGVGYECQAPMSTFYCLSEVGAEISLYTHLIVREDAQLLYAFHTEMERTLFRALIKVNGVGPKLALGILSGMSVQEFVSAVTQDDKLKLVRLPGVGKKTAERLLIEMSDRLAALNIKPVADDTTVAITGATQSIGHAVNDAISALVALGYKPQDAKRVIDKIKQDGQSSEDLIRGALQVMVP